MINSVKTLIKQYYVTLLMLTFTLTLFAISNNGELFWFNNLLILEDYQWWRIVTSIFSHSSLDHLTWNVITLISTSVICESLNRRLFVVYLTVALLLLTIFKFSTQADDVFSLGFSNVSGGSFALLSLLICRLGIKENKLYVTVTAATILCLLTLHEFGLFGSRSGMEMLTGRSIGDVSGKQFKLGHVVGIGIGLLVGFVAIFVEFLRESSRK